MTIFFLITLIASLAIAICLAILTIHRLQINLTRQNKKGIFFLLPAVIVIILFFVIIYDTFPRMLDTINAIQNNVKTIQVNTEDILINKNQLMIDGQTYLLSINHAPIEDHSDYTFSYLPHTKIIVNQEKVATLPDSETLVPVVEETAGETGHHSE